ncbi:hypothetical protein RSOL_073440 [Rhizoctonia solani AG-3 Rhs1AP]|nr:hypothetical protein RSOL_073440 [Rhizoctonia solani AG-3 Rhs1AP]
MPRLNEIFIEVCSVQETLDPGQTGALWFLKPSHERIPPDMGYGPSQQKWSDSFGIHLDSWEQWMEVIDSVKCWEEYIDTFRSLGQVPGRIDNTFIDLFEQSMAIRVVYGAIVQRGSAQETSPNFNMEDVPRYRRPRSSIFGWRKAKQEQEQQMTPATIIDMQKYLIRLIDAHSIRVEQYKWATKAIATDVASDIKRVADEVWSNLIEFS